MPYADPKKQADANRRAKRRYYARKRAVAAGTFHVAIPEGATLHEAVLALRDAWDKAAKVKAA